MHKLLITLYAVWPLGVILARTVSAVRIRFLIVTALTWVTALMIGTSGSPTDAAMTGGLMVGAGCCVFLWLAVNRGVTFTWDRYRTYWKDEGGIPAGELAAGLVVAGVGVVAVLLRVAG